MSDVEPSQVLMPSTTPEHASSHGSMASSSSSSGNTASPQVPMIRRNPARDQ